MERIILKKVIIYILIVNEKLISLSSKTESFITVFYKNNSLRKLQISIISIENTNLNILEISPTLDSPIIWLFKIPLVF